MGALKSEGRARGQEHERQHVRAHGAARVHTGEDHGWHRDERCGARDRAKHRRDEPDAGEQHDAKRFHSGRLSDRRNRRWPDARSAIAAIGGEVIAVRGARAG
jgi:hypothetical protein